MPFKKTELYIHLVWTTWKRSNLIEPEFERRLYRYIASVSQNMGCKILAINGTTDHVHVLVKMPPSISVSEVVHRIKGASSRFVNDEIRPDYYFKWQAKYGAFSVSKRDLPRVTAYIKRQKIHHSAGDVVEEMEYVLDENAETTE